MTRSLLAALAALALTSAAASAAGANETLTSSARVELGALPFAPPPAVPRATCRPGDRPETGIQGDPGDNGGFRCGVRLVGQYTGDGAAIGMAYYGDCAYMSTFYSSDDPQYAQRKGAVVVDAADPAHPRETARLQTQSMVQPHESLKANQARGLLAADQGGPLPAPQVPGEPFQISPGAGFDLYDVRSDCAHPKLLASVQLPNGSGHEGDFAPDGMTYYESTIENAPNPSLIAIDLSDPARPHSIQQWSDPLRNTYAFHGLQIQPGGDVGLLAAQDGADNGLAVADLAGIQSRSGDLTPRVIGHVAWHDTDVTQIPVRATIGGHPYAIVADENGATRNAGPDCANGESPFGFLHIVDLADPAHPRVAGTVSLQIDQPANCTHMLAEGGLISELAFSSHYCAVDDPDHTTAVACTWMGAGLRVFDVRDVAHPREIAYYVPQGNPAVTRGDATHASIIANPNLDATGSPIRWVRTAIGTDLWFVSTENGFQIVRLDPAVYPFASSAAGGSSAACHSRRIIRFTVPHGASRVRVTVDGRPRAQRRSGHSLLLPLTGLPRRAVGDSCR